MTKTSALQNCDAESRSEQLFQLRKIGSGKVPCSCVYYDTRVFASDYYPEEGSFDCEIDIGDIENCKVPELSSTKEWDIHYLYEEEKIAHIDALRRLASAHQSRVSFDMALELQIPLKSGEYNAFETIESGLQFLKDNLELTVIYMERIKNAFQQLHLRWKKTGQALELNNFRYLTKFRFFVAAVDEKLKDVQDRVENQQKSLIEPPDAIRNLKAYAALCKKTDSNRVPIFTPANTTLRKNTFSKVTTSSSIVTTASLSSSEEIDSAEKCSQFVASLQQAHQTPSAIYPDTPITVNRRVAPATAANSNHRGRRPNRRASSRTTPGYMGATIISQIRLAERAAAADKNPKRQVRRAPWRP